MDENAIKSILQMGQAALANETLCLRSVVICDGPDPANPDKDDDRDGCEDTPSSVAVKVTALKVEGKQVNLKNFGTDAVTLDTWTQSEYQP